MNDTKHNTGNTDVVLHILQLTHEMALETNPHKLVTLGLNVASKIFSCERALLIVEKESAPPHVIESVGTASEAPFSTTALALAREKNHPLLISDTIDNIDLSSGQSIVRHDIRTILCAHLSLESSLFENQSVFLYLDSHTSKQPFTGRDLQHFKILVSLMSSLVHVSEQRVAQEATIEALKEQMAAQRFDDIIYTSENFKQCITLIEQSAPTDVPVLILGETGTGKERLARLVHRLSNREKGPFIAVNCGAIPPNLIESHLFGHEKGAFTGALAQKKGFFEEAHEGTLFLDEIGELPQSVQSHFLRVLQEGEINRVGSTKPIKVNVRIVAATHVRLESAIENGSFRQDLFYRLNVISVTVPPVRDREDDAVLLAHYFLNHYGKTLGIDTHSLSRDAEKAILSYDWPGNVREIQNRIQRAVIISQGKPIDSTMLGLTEAKPHLRKTLRQAREELDCTMIKDALKKAPDNLTQAAKILDIDRKSLRILIEKYGL